MRLRLAHLLRLPLSRRSEVDCSSADCVVGILGDSSLIPCLGKGGLPFICDEDMVTPLLRVKALQVYQGSASSRVGITGLLVKTHTFLPILTWSLLREDFVIATVGSVARVVPIGGAGLLQNAVFAFSKISPLASLLSTGVAGFLLQLRTGIAAVAVKIHDHEPICLPMRRRYVGRSVGSVSCSHCRLVLPREVDGPRTPRSSSLKVSLSAARVGVPVIAGMAGSANLLRVFACAVCMLSSKGLGDGMGFLAARFKAA